MRGLTSCPRRCCRKSHPTKQCLSSCPEVRHLTSQGTTGAIKKPCRPRVLIVSVGHAINAVIHDLRVAPELLHCLNGARVLYGRTAGLDESLRDGLDREVHDATSEAAQRRLGRIAASSPKIAVLCRREGPTPWTGLNLGQRRDCHFPRRCRPCGRHDRRPKAGVSRRHALTLADRLDLQWPPASSCE
jgi:hypothetical protein